jgi:hypothetical protein
MECALTLSKSGNYLPELGDKKDKKKKDFADINWGGNARNWFLKTTEITEIRWDCILYDVAAYVSELEEEYQGKDGAGNELAADPRTLIILDWYVILIQSLASIC